MAMSEWFRRLQVLAGREQFDRDLQEEMRMHQELRARELAQAGARSDDAGAAARRRFGNATLLREQSRDAWGLRWLDDLLQDLRYGFRTMLRTRGFSVAAVLTIALAIGATTAIFSTDDAVLLRTLPYKDPGRLVEIFQRYFPNANMDRMSVAPANYLDWKAQTKAFEGVAAYRLASYNLTSGDNPERVRAAETSANTLDVLGVEPLLGRGFQPAEDSEGSAPVVLLSYGLWQRRFAGDPAIVGKTIRANGTTYTVIGVMPQRFRFPIGWLATEVEMWAPLVFKAADRADRGSTPLDVVARLAPGVSMRQAQSEIDVVARRLSAAYPATNKEWGANLMPLSDRGVIGYRDLFIFLSLAVAVVLLVACANVANLLLARGIGRQRELTVRSALGAARTRIVRQLLTEGILLSIVGGAAGALLAYWGVSVVARIAPVSDMPELKNVALNARVLAFSAGVSIVAGLLFSVVPAITNSSLSLSASLAENARSSNSARQNRFKLALAVGEIALTVALLACAATLVRSFKSYMNSDPGFDAGHVLVMRLSLPKKKYTEPSQWAAFYAAMDEAVRSMPGVSAAAIASGAPMEQSYGVFRYDVGGKATAPGTQPAFVAYIRATSGYFQTAGIALHAGRTFNSADTETSTPVAVINQTLARREFAGRDPIGQWLTLQGDVNSSVNADDHGRRVQIVGVVRDVHEDFLFHGAPAMVYAPMAQDPQPVVSLMIKSAAPESALLPEVRRRLLKIDPDQPVYAVRTLDSIFRDSHALFRFNTLILASFAILATLLSLTGIYGVIAYSVAQRTREFGIRIALGSSPVGIFRLVLRQAAKVGIIGVAIGGLAAVPSVRLLASALKHGMFIDLVGNGWLLLLATCGAMLAVALFATYVPARRATRIDPMVALRYE